MQSLRIFTVLILSVISTLVSAQVKIRLFSGRSPESVTFRVIRGKYQLNSFNGRNINLSQADLVLISKFEGKLAIKTRNEAGFVCDSVIISALKGDDSFSLRLNGANPLLQNYYGDLKCFPDMETLVLINVTDIEKYIAGVVWTEGGSGKNIEYFKAQAVIARTYLFKYFDKHLPDRYNLCDDIHCQSFKGLSPDTVINKASYETRGLVILDRDSSLIMSAFHANCGGETSSSDDVWLTGLPYLKRVVDPYCLNSRNAIWEKSISLNEWLRFLKESGYKGKTDDPSVFSFTQGSRLTDYKITSYAIPLKTLRSEMNLKSTFFSVFAEGDSIHLKGRGYGHGVGLCQEGAMVMAEKGFKYLQILNFYYTGVFISDIKNAVILTSRNYLLTQ